MAKPGEHTYAPITCARTNPTWSPSPLSSLSATPLPLSVARHCALCLQFQLWLFPLCLPCQHDIWRVDIFIDFGIYSYCRLSVPPRTSSAPVHCPLPFRLSVGIPSCRCFFAAWKLIKNVCSPMLGPIPSHTLCLSLCVRVCGRTRCHIAHTPSGTNWTWAHAGTA